MESADTQGINQEREKFSRSDSARPETTSPPTSVSPPKESFSAEDGPDLAFAGQPPKTEKKFLSERKHITALFADVSGYTTLAELLDPEELKDIISLLIKEMTKVVDKYEGSLENFAGDQIMVLFGFPRIHEDDSIRAIKTAMEIHRLAAEISRKFQETINYPVAVHIGINSGLAVTGQADFNNMTPHIAGDTINVASRLCSLAKPGETLVGQTTYTQSAGFFLFETLDAVQVKGKSLPIQVYKLLGDKDLPCKTHRVSGLRVEIIGRSREMAILNTAVERLRKGRGAFIAICGEAGTGKSRLIEEFKASLDPETIDWVEGHAYNYTQNISYYPLIDLISRELGIKESDTPEQIAAKLEAKVDDLFEAREAVLPYIGNLLSLNYPETTRVSPDFLKSRLHQAILQVLKTTTQRAPTVICLEDLHWADVTFLDLIRSLVLREGLNGLTLCTYRPPLKLFSEEEIRLIGEGYVEIQLNDLSQAEAQEMVVSILKTDKIPKELRQYIQEKVGGNPFYLEEMINSLIELGTLKLENNHWEFTRDIADSDIPTTIHAVISDRIDRLDIKSRHLLQEAAVMGRAIPYEILRRITINPDSLDTLLNELEHLDLIRRTDQSGKEYIFKHALIQEVVYSSLLKKDRQALHERIAFVMEHFFQDRLPEIYETLAFHFKHGKLDDKARKYFTESGRKSLKKYAVQESHLHFEEAFKILGNNLGESEEEKKCLVEFLNEWAQVFYYRGDFKGLIELLLGLKEIIESMEDKFSLGLYYGWLGYAMIGLGRMRESYDYSAKALKLGEEINSYPVKGLAYATLIWACAEKKLLDQGIEYGHAIEKIFMLENLEPIIFFTSRGSLGLVYLFKGDSDKIFEIAKNLLEYGETHSNLRSIAVGYIINGYGCYAKGDFVRATEFCKKAIECLEDPLFSEWAKVLLCMIYLVNNQIDDAAEIIAESLPVCKLLGFGLIETSAQVFHGAVLIAKGQISRGLKILERMRQLFIEEERLFSLYITDATLAEIYFAMATQTHDLDFQTIMKNLFFILTELPFSKSRAEAYLKKVIEVGREVQSQGFLHGQALFHLGELLKLKGKKAPALEYLDEAQQIFQRCGSMTYLKRCQEALGSVC
jgi:class 3 adenylate cyclase/tetratricopeptide (TPR) repeat protein